MSQNRRRADLEWFVESEHCPFLEEPEKFNRGTDELR